LGGLGIPYADSLEDSFMTLFEVEIPEKQVCKPRQNRRILKSDQSGRIFKLLRRRGGRHAGARQVSALTELSELKVGERGILIALDLPDSVQNHLMHMGFVPDSCIHTLRRAPAGDPTVYCVDGMEIALRHETAAAIRVRLCVGTTANSEPAEAAPQLAEAAR
jgi:ferrous iron transport protein A